MTTSPRIDSSSSSSFLSSSISSSPTRFVRMATDVRPRFLSVMGEEDDGTDLFDREGKEEILSMATLKLIDAVNSIREIEESERTIDNVGKLLAGPVAEKLLEKMANEKNPLTKQRIAGLVATEISRMTGKVDANTPEEVIPDPKQMAHLVLGVLEKMGEDRAQKLGKKENFLYLVEAVKAFDPNNPINSFLGMLKNFPLGGLITGPLLLSEFFLFKEFPYEAEVIWWVGENLPLVGPLIAQVLTYPTAEKIALGLFLFFLGYAMEKGVRLACDKAGVKQDTRDHLKAIFAQLEMSKKVA